MAINPEHTVDVRQRTGADRWDEMWNGVRHVPPMPNRSHQDLEFALEAWLREHWVPISGGCCYHQINVASPGSWPNDYRIPDIVLLMPDRFAIDKNEYFDGGPSVVVEIRTPRDETYAKFDFYASVGVEEIWVVDRDAHTCELYRLADGTYQPIATDSTGTCHSHLTGVRLSTNSTGNLVVQLGDDATTHRELPQHTSR